MADVRWMFITNVGFVDFFGVRLWCNAIIIDEPTRDGRGGDIRQIRGLTWGGMDVFTMWISPPESEVEIIDAKGGRLIMMSNDGNNYNMDSGIIIKAGKQEIKAYQDDYKKPISIERNVAPVPFGDVVDEEILKYSGGINYPRVVWTRKPERQIR